MAIILYTKGVIIFDLDGTIVDTKKGIIEALNFVLCSYGMQKIRREDEWDYIGPSVYDSFKNKMGFSEDKAKEATFLYRKNYIEKNIYNFELYHGVKEVLLELKKRGYILGIATMKTKKQVEKLFELANLIDFFDIIKYALDDGSYKKYQMLLDIKKHYQCEYYYMIGDTIGDYNAAKDAEIQFVFANYGYGSLEEFFGLQANNCFDYLKIFE